MTFQLQLKVLTSENFNSHPHEEDDEAQDTLEDLYIISTHILTKRMTIFSINCPGTGAISTHILTKRMTAILVTRIISMIFQLTSSRRGWLQAFARCSQHDHFNSHPHEEDDRFADNMKEIYNISTHILTKRMTAYEQALKNVVAISTHILTKRMTIQEDDANANITFQLTSSRRGWLPIEGTFDGDRAFQLTSSRRGWP